MIHILVVDDELVNLKIIEDTLEDSGYVLSKSSSGECAWDKLSKKDTPYSAVVLDRMMPGMDGIEVLKKIQNDSDLRDIPVILQTALGSNDDILEGLQEGAFYYLTKPYSKNVLVSIVNLAVESYSRYSKAKDELHKSKNISKFLKSGYFEITTLDDVLEISPILSNFFPDPGRALTGILEILTNSIEHGNLGIGFETKQNLLQKDEFHAEVKRRLSLDENKDKKVSISLERNRDRVALKIKDSGIGFNFSDYGNVTDMKESLFKSSGRGILIARSLSFDELNYIGNGNTVEAIVYNKGSRVC